MQIKIFAIFFAIIRTKYLIVDMLLANPSH